MQLYSQPTINAHVYPVISPTTSILVNYYGLVVKESYILQPTCLDEYKSVIQRCSFLTSVAKVSGT
jgi:hypothetical protein